MNGELDVTSHASEEALQSVGDDGHRIDMSEFSPPGTAGAAASDGVAEQMRDTAGHALEPRSITDVLSAWRAAERRLEGLHAGSEEWQSLQDEIETLRGRHGTLFRAADSEEGGL
jgi:hypothetical protein